MTRRAISTTGAPAAIGPYSQGIVVDGFLFSAGQAALDPASGALVAGGIEPETERVMANLTAVLDAAGASWADVVKTNTFVTNYAEFAKCSDVRMRYIGVASPTSTTIQISGLAQPEAMVEIELIAVVN